MVPWPYETVGGLSQLGIRPELHVELVESDLAGRFRRDEQGQLLFNFGKCQGESLRAVAISEPSYLAWMLDSGNYLEDVRTLIRRALVDEPLVPVEQSRFSACMEPSFGLQSIQ